MKLILVFALVILSISALARSAGNQGRYCYKLARQELRGLITTDQMVRLCSGTTRSSKPVRCFERGIQDFGLTKDQSVKICEGTFDLTGPFSCLRVAAREERRGGAKLTLNQKVNLCSGTADASDPVDCLQAQLDEDWNDLTIDQAIIACKAF